MASSLQSNIHFFYEMPVALRNRTKLKDFIREIFKKEKRNLESLNYIFCSDKRLLEINRQYLKHDYYTDIITFELSTPGSPISSEIYISVERVKDNALKAGTSFTNELHRVIFHGVLHLCNYKDKTKAEKEMMRAMENKTLDRYFKQLETINGKR